MSERTRFPENGAAPSGTSVLEFSLVNKVALAVRGFATGSMGLLCLLPVPAFYYDWERVEQYTPLAEFLMATAFVLFGLYCLRFSILCFWRLLGPDFDVRIEDGGLRLHPSRCLRLIPWRSIRRSSVWWKEPGTRYEGYHVLELELAHPILPPTWPFPTRKLSVIPVSGRSAAMEQIGREVEARRLAARRRE